MTGAFKHSPPPFRPSTIYLKEQGPTINFNAGLRTESVQMSVADFVRVEEPMVADIAASD